MRKYSKVQNAYLIAKANLEILETQQNEVEQNYIVKNKITNLDGTIPEYIYCIDNEKVFNKANEDVSKAIEESGLWNEILEAKELLKDAETELISWGINRVKKDLPNGAYETLQRGLKQYDIRCKLIDLSLKVVF